MTIAQDIIRDAFEEGALLAAEVYPTAAQEKSALRRLNKFVRSLYGYEMGEELVDWNVPSPQRTAPVAANYPALPYPMGLDGIALTSPLASDATFNVWPYPPANSRIIFGSVANTVYFPEQPSDGSRMSIVQGSGAGDGGSGGATLTLNGNGRTIEGSNTYAANAPITTRQWLYRADLGDWTAVLNMALTDSLPFPDELDDLFITGLQIRLAPRYSKKVSDETKAEFKRMMGMFKARYRQAAVTVYGSDQFPRALESYIVGQWFW